ncbi:DNA-3-methyladenine glycosylase [Limosilactobacillus secaliphilus]|uniref:Putative 3-methyladenine DNA glycosylase n=1 Tax=Limosilactobacillus secaliphilus TaxID=396268 RepID=A0A0R2I053_9LACO|nr:DNA-3-methyladenine glycosylase [Limosilactobacillus secaliphilus]KRN58521.1 DNA-3-methyladenine glycosylase II [Limosilactobacillus secaliphilus]
MLTTYQQFFTKRPTKEIAQDLLGRMLVYDGPKGKVGGWIVETEAYLGVNDTASHAYGGRHTNYSKSLYGNPGDLYIYQIRSHYCVDIVVQDQGEPQGILLRAIEPAINLPLMKQNRSQTGVAISNGPGKLMMALGVQSRAMDGQPMEKSPLKIELDQRRTPKQIAVSPRIGVNLKQKDGKALNRFYVAGNPYVSGMRKRDSDLETHGWR